MLNIIPQGQLRQNPLPSPTRIKQELPATPSQLEFISQARSQVKAILDGQDPRLLLVVGPCSIHDITAAKEYAIHLRKLSLKISSSFLVVMRTYFEKPRTALGWKGLLHDPHLDGTNDLSTGLRLSRELLLYLADLGLAAATEILEPATANYLCDLISWGCVGARTSESQIHRQCASGLPMPVAFKNSTSGNIDVAINGILSANCPHHFLGINDFGSIAEIQTEGNPYAHIALRGGEDKSNYDQASIAYTLERLKKHGLPERLIIDCSHDNSLRKYEKQEEVFCSVIKQYIEGCHAIKGIALESNLASGHQTLTQEISHLRYGVSITDPCMDWESTERLLLFGKEALENACKTSCLIPQFEETSVFAEL